MRLGHIRGVVASVQPLGTPAHLATAGSANVNST
jgi:hypothetical protein